MKVIAMGIFAKTKKREADPYAVLQRVVLSAQLWESRMKELSATKEGVQRAARIVRHMHRLYRLAIRCQMALAK